MMCPGNKVKVSSGNAPYCDADPAYDGVSKVPNNEHTQCGKFLFSFHFIVLN